MENMDALLSKPETLEWVRQRVASTNLSRYQRARELCEKYKWRDVQGRFKEMACRKRLCQWHRQGLGTIGSTLDGPIGLHMHETLVFTPEGTPLGLIDVQVWARDDAEFGKKHKRKSKPIEEKESYKWIQSWQATVKAQAAAPNTQMVMVADRESDIYEFFALTQGERTQLLVRAEQNRTLTDSELNLWPHMEALPTAGQIEVLAGRKKEQPARTCARSLGIARLTVRHSPVTLAPPKPKRHLGLCRFGWSGREKKTRPKASTPSTGC